MAGSTYGTLFSITTWGESHGAAIGVVIDGCPAGLSLSNEDIQIFLNRRRPGQGKYSTTRTESDTAEILSGVFEGKTTGTPISIIVRNEDHRSKDYGNIKDCYRPGHADYTYDAKYGFRDYRGGGRSSGRETIGRVAAGAIASKILDELGITVSAYAKEISPRLDECILQKDSCGGIIECTVTGMPAGIGEPVFEKLDANLTKAVMSIGSVKGVEIGAGFEAAKSLGSENNDAFTMNGTNISKKTNHSGGILGGISDGDTIILRAAIKPTPSIGQEQETVTTNGEETTITISGRHDPIIVPRAVVVVESMVAITLVDMLFMNMSAKMENLLKIYDK